ncbi:MAG: radical SAM protein [Phycisphaeraceae bacterium]|nr:radical SAM protein [Phycisphaeraceae bacterium]
MSSSRSDAATLRINEIFHSIQGESSWMGVPCVFIRLAGCPLRCRYCDTEYAFREGRSRDISEIVREVVDIGCPLIEITGGEPLAQSGVFSLITALADAGCTVLIETSGAVDISPCDPRSIRILDLKTPGSGESHRNLWSNLDHLRERDEIKFVITDRGDYEWARRVMTEHRLVERCRCVLMSPVFEQAKGLEIAGAKGLEPRQLAEWILADRLPVRMQLQLHKFIWAPATRGV